MPSQQDKAVSKSGLWHCPICTYDNEESSLSCDMCGVCQGSSVNIGKHGRTFLPSDKEFC